MDICGVLRVTWLPRARLPEPSRPPEPRTAAPELPASEPSAQANDLAPSPDVVRGLIVLADDLIDLTEHASGTESSTRTLRLVLRRVDRLLSDCGVQVVRDEGPVLASRHEVVGARPAGADGTEGWIAATVRRGYLQGDRLIRPQQVMAYTIGHRAGTDERSGSEE